MQCLPGGQTEGSSRDGMKNEQRFWESCRDRDLQVLVDLIPIYRRAAARRGVVRCSRKEGFYRKTSDKIYENMQAMFHFLGKSNVLFFVHNR